MVPWSPLSVPAHHARHGHLPRRPTKYSVSGLSTQFEPHHPCPPPPSQVNPSNPPPGCSGGDTLVVVTTVTRARRLLLIVLCLVRRGERGAAAAAIGGGRVAAGAAGGRGAAAARAARVRRRPPGRARRRGAPRRGAPQAARPRRCFGPRRGRSPIAPLHSGSFRRGGEVIAVATAGRSLGGGGGGWGERCREVPRRRGADGPAHLRRLRPRHGTCSIDSPLDHHIQLLAFSTKISK